MQLVIHTQYLENYGAHAWDGVGECPRYWKCKGGSIYIVTGISANESAQFSAIVERAAKHFDCVYANDHSQEYVIDWEVAEDGVRAWDEWETPKKVSVTLLTHVFP